MNSAPPDNGSVNQNETKNKTPFLKNFTQFFKKGSNAFGHLFGKKEKLLESNISSGKSTIVKDNNLSHKLNTNSNFALTQNKQIFKIEEDEEGKEKIYHLEDDDEDDEDYDEEDETDIKLDEKIKTEDKNKVESLEEHNLSNNSTSLKSQNDNQSSQNVSHEESSSNAEIQKNSQTGTLSLEEPLDNIEKDYDIHSVIHRVYYKVFNLI